MTRFVIPSLILLGLLVGCDTTGPADDPEPHFELETSAPLNASVEGKATLGNNLSFGEQNLFVHPLPQLEKTVTIVQLSGEYEGSVTHDLSFMRLGDGALESGTYEVGMNTSCDSPCVPGFFPEELFTASYGRQTPDSLHFYPLESGTVEVEQATEEVVEGTFSLEAAMKASVSRADMEAFLDSLPDGSPSDTSDLPHPPQPEVQLLEPPLTIEGSFTATPGSLSDQVVRPQWSVSGGVVPP